jgi:CheY-like chemotaxis protein
MNNKKTVLVVEDDTRTRSLIQRYAEKSGLAVIEATNADDAWKHLTHPPHPDLIITEVDLPGSSMNGIDLLARLRERETEKHVKHIPAIVHSHFLSVTGEKRSREEQVKALPGDNSFTTKRLITGLTERIQEKLGGKHRFVR